MAKDKKKKKDRNSADTHRSGAETATTDVTDAAGGGNLAANSLVSNADNSSEKMADAISNALTEVVPEVTFFLLVHTVSEISVGLVEIRMNLLDEIDFGTFVCIRSLGVFFQIFV